MATFSNTNRNLWPGEFLQVKVLLGIDKHATVVPANVVQTSLAIAASLVGRSQPTLVGQLRAHTCRPQPSSPVSARDPSPICPDARGGLCFSRGETPAVGLGPRTWLVSGSTVQPWTGWLSKQAAAPQTHPYPSPTPLYPLPVRSNIPQLLCSA